MKHTFPFRLGATSYVYPAGLVENARRLAGSVDDMELVLFDVPGHGTNFPTPPETRSLNEIARAEGLTYTVHLPLDIQMDNALALQQAKRVIDATAVLEPFAFVMHLDGKKLMEHASPERVARWQDDARGAICRICEWVGDKQKVCIENIEAWDSSYFALPVRETGVARCVDVGHLWLQGTDAVPYLNTYLAQTRVIHLHGVRGRDHQSLWHMDPELVKQALVTIQTREFDGVLTLEVFGEGDFFSSRSNLLQVWAEAAV